MVYRPQMGGFACSGCNPMGTRRCSRYNEKCFCKSKRYTGQYCDQCNRMYDYMDRRGECHGCPCNLQWSNGSCIYMASLGAPGCTLCKPGMAGRLCDECDTDAGYVFDIPTSRCVPLSDELPHAHTDLDLFTTTLPAASARTTTRSNAFAPYNLSSSTITTSTTSNSNSTTTASSAVWLSTPALAGIAVGAVLLLAVLLLLAAAAWHIRRRSRQHRVQNTPQQDTHVVNVIPNKLFDLADTDSESDEESSGSGSVLRVQRKRSNKQRKLITSMQQALSTGPSQHYYHLSDQLDDDAHSF